MDCTTAEPIVAGCSSLVYDTSGLSSTALASDPLHTIYGLSPYVTSGFTQFFHQKWLKITNTFPDSKYFQLTITNLELISTDVAAGLFSECPPVNALGAPDFINVDNVNRPDLTSFHFPINGGSIDPYILGYMIQPNQTIWIEIASSLAGNIQLDWNLLDATDKDRTNKSTTYDPMFGGDGAVFSSNPVEMGFIHHGGSYFIAEGIGYSFGQPMGTFPGGTQAPGARVHKIDSDGTVSSYDINLDYYFGWDGDIIDVTVDLCTFKITKFRTSWNVGFTPGIGDAKFASDGANLWLGIITPEGRRYPWYQQKYPSTSPGADVTGYFANPADLEAASFSGNYWAFTGSFFCQGSGAPFDDLGLNGSQRWQAFKLKVFIWNGAGFTLLGEEEAAYANTGGNGGVDGYVSGLEMAAAPAEPGVCHVVWSEYGNWGERDSGIETWPNRGSRINYTKWGPGSQLNNVDLLRYDAIYDLVPYPPPSRPDGLSWSNFSNVYQRNDPWGPDLNSERMCFTPAIALKNDHGWPVLFVSKVLIFAGSVDTQYGTDQCEATIRMWDLRSPVANAPVELQRITSDLLPSPTDTADLGGFQVLRHGFYEFLSGRKNQRNFAISTKYADPLLGGDSVYLLHVGWTSRASDSTDLFPGEALGMYRIRCDGSTPFDYLDGRREISMFPPAAGPIQKLPIADFFSEPRNVWIPTYTANFGFITYNSLWQFDRVCNNGWLQDTLVSTETSSVENLVRLAASSPIHYDPGQNKFFYPTIWSPTKTQVGVGASEILRDRVCTTGECAFRDVKVWHRLGHKFGSG